MINTRSQNFDYLKTTMAQVDALLSHRSKHVSDMTPEEQEEYWARRRDEEAEQAKQDERGAEDSSEDGNP